MGDLLAHRVVVLDRTLQPVNEWMRGELVQPDGLFLAPKRDGDDWQAHEHLIVTDPGQHRLFRLFDDGATIEPLGEVGAALKQFRSPTDALEDRQGNLYVADAENRRVQIIKPDGAVTGLGDRGDDTPHVFVSPGGLGIYPESGQLHLADPLSNVIWVFEPVTRTLTTTLPLKDAPPEAQLSYPTDVAVDWQGTAFVADSGHRRVAVFGADGRYLRQISDLRGPFTPTSLALGLDGRLLIVDAARGRLLVATKEGAYVAEVGAIPLPQTARPARTRRAVLAALLALTALAGSALAAWWLAAGVLADWHAVDRAEGRRRLFGAMMAAVWPRNPWFSAFQQVVDGALQGSGPLRLPGPGLVLLTGASAGVFERFGQVSRVSGPGMVVTQFGEALRAVFDLRLQTQAIDQSEETVYSREGVPLKVKFSIQYRIMQDEAALVTEGRYVLEDDVLRRAALNAADWRQQTEQAARAALREAISARYLELIFDPRSTVMDGQLSPRAPLQFELQRRLDRLAQRWGVEVVRVTLDELRMPRDVSERLLQIWDIQWRRWAEVEHARTDAWKESAKEAVRLADRKRELEAARDVAGLLKQARGAEVEAEMEAERIRAGMQAELAQLMAHADVDRARGKAEAKAITGRGEALARVEYLRQLLAVLGQADPQILEDKGLMEMLVRLAAFSDLSKIEALAAFLAREQILPAAPARGEMAAEPPPAGEDAGAGQTT